MAGLMISGFILFLCCVGCNFPLAGGLPMLSLVCGRGLVYRFCRCLCCRKRQPDMYEGYQGMDDNRYQFRAQV